MKYFLDILTFVVSLFAAIGTVINAWALIKYSKINVVNGLQQLMLAKANFCNSLWNEARETAAHPQMDLRIVYTPVITEVIVSIQLLDNSLMVYSEKGRRQFLLNQFWIELNTSLREFIKNSTVEELQGALKQQILDLKCTFEPFFKQY